MAKATQAQIGLLVLAGIGAGTLLGALAGLLLGRRAVNNADTDLTDSVDALKERAEHVLDELSENVSDLVGRSRHLLSETHPPR